MSNKATLPAQVNLDRLLADIASELGLSFAAREPRHFAMLGARDLEEFADAVLIAEGLELEFHRDLRAQVRKLVGRHCLAALQAELTPYLEKAGQGKRRSGTLHLPAKKRA